MKQFIYVIALFLGVYMVNAQQTITGKVQDQDGIDLPGASIVVDGTNNATTSDFDGNLQFLQIMAINSSLVLLDMKLLRL